MQSMTREPVDQGGAQRTEPARRWLPLAAWLGGLIVGTWLFHALGSGPLAAPPLDPAGWSAWLAERDALIASVAALRLVVLALSWYLVGVTTVGLVARLARAARLVRLADALTVPFVRRLLQATLGVSLATAMVASAMPSGSLPALDDERSVTLSAMPEVGDTADPGSERAATAAASAASRVELRAVSGEREDEVTLERIAPRPMPLELLDRARDRAGVEDATDATEAPEASDTGESSDEYVVVAGDSLWSIAESALTGTDGQAPGERALGRYWQELIDSNRDVLVDPDNPDLIFPGQVVRLPERPA
jgi:hypothetical protein